MYYGVSELNFELCIKEIKEGFFIPLYKCKIKKKCRHYQKQQGRKRCPGRLKSFDNVFETKDNCGWYDGVNTIPIRTSDLEKFIPKHIIPII